MKFIANLFSSLIMAGWIGASAIFSIQNIQPVSLQFFGFESVQLTVGVLLAFCLGMGMILGSFLSLFWQKSSRARRRSY